MCHQTVSLVARHLEANGIPTVIVGCAKDIVEHWEKRRARVITEIEGPGKALIVCATREIAANLYRQIVELRPDASLQLAALLRQFYPPNAAPPEAAPPPSAKLPSMPWPGCSKGPPASSRSCAIATLACPKTSGCTPPPPAVKGCWLPAPCSTNCSKKLNSSRPPNASARSASHGAAASTSIFNPYLACLVCVRARKRLVSTNMRWCEPMPTCSMSS